MSKIKAVCVYCGSSPGTEPDYVKAAAKLGKSLAENGVRLIYGGGSVGLMGAIADSVIKHGGAVTGIIPEFLMRKERAARQGEMIVTRDMHERKRRMFDMADAFVALPGGIGTLEELVEQLTWAQLGRHQKPVLLANINGFWAPLVDLIDHMQSLGFIHASHRLRYLIVDRIEDALPSLFAHWAKTQPPTAAEQRTIIERL